MNQVAFKHLQLLSGVSLLLQLALSLLNLSGKALALLMLLIADVPDVVVSAPHLSTHLDDKLVKLSLLALHSRKSALQSLNLTGKGSDLLFSVEKGHVGGKGLGSQVGHLGFELLNVEVSLT